MLSPTGELGAALVTERRDAPSAILRLEAAPKAVGLAAQARFEREVARRAGELAKNPDRDGRVLRDRPRDPEGGVPELRARHDLLDEPPVRGSRCVDEV